MNRIRIQSNPSPPMIACDRCGAERTLDASRLRNALDAITDFLAQHQACPPFT